MSITENSEFLRNEFKLKIISQLKNPYFGLNCLLSKQIAENRITYSRRNVAPSNFKMVASEFDLTLNFIFDESLQNNYGTSLPVEDGAHHVVFDDYDGDDTVLDISNPDELGRIVFFEEVILPSFRGDNVIVMGLREYRIELSDNYEFCRMCNTDDIIEPITFDLNELTFDNDVEEKIGAWNYLWSTSYIQNNCVYLEHFITDNRYNDLVPLIQASKLTQEHKDKFLNFLGGRWMNHADTTRMSCIAGFLKEVKQIQETI